jgi:hypothetical protein
MGRCGAGLQIEGVYCDQFVDRSCEQYDESGNKSQTVISTVDQFRVFFERLEEQ